MNEMHHVRREFADEKRTRRSKKIRRKSIDYRVVYRVFELRVFGNVMTVARKPWLLSHGSNLIQLWRSNVNDNLRITFMLFWTRNSDEQIK